MTLLTFEGFRQVVHDFFQGQQPDAEALAEVEDYLNYLESEALKGEVSESKAVVDLMRGEKIETP